MDAICIDGGQVLKGSVPISGAKNSVLLILAASVLIDKPIMLNNVPNISDVHLMCELLEILNVQVEDVGPGSLLIDASNVEYTELNSLVVEGLRASILFLGVLLGKFKKVKMREPGGCHLGERPIDRHLSAVTQLGASVQFEGGKIEGVLSAEGMSRSVQFEKPTVTGTANALLCAVSLPGETMIEGAVLEPEIDDLIGFLNHFGAKVKRDGRKILVEGMPKWKRGYYHIMPDRIEAGTFLIAACMMQSHIELSNIKPEHLTAVFRALESVGANIEISERSVKLEMNTKPKALDISIGPYPDFPTDLQPQWTVLASISDGKSRIVDSVYSERFDHVDELIKMGAKIELNDSGICVHGVDSLHSAQIVARNIRCAAALVLAAMIAVGKSDILQISILNRGYEGFFNKINMNKKQSDKREN